MSLVPFPPWHLATAQQWLGQRERFAHAWLVHGAAGIGKLDFAAAAAASLLCESPAQGLACGHCPACTWVASGNHPDLRRIRPDALAEQEGQANAEATPEAEEAPASGSAKKTLSKEIRIDQIRALESWFYTATHRGGWRVALVYPAQALNVISANALLKVLEEPPPHTVFLLVADAPDRLLPTLVSRCRRLPLAMPDHQTALQWLQAQGVSQSEDWLAAAGGAPLTARRQAAQADSPVPSWLVNLLKGLAEGVSTDVGTLAETLEKMPAAEWLDTLLRAFTDLNLAAHGAPLRYFPSLAQATGAVAARAQPARLADTARWLLRQRALAGHPLNGKLFAHAALQRVVLSCQA